jgi:hypothetical protein
MSRFTEEECCPLCGFLKDCTCVECPMCEGEGRLTYQGITEACACCDGAGLVSEQAYFVKLGLE